MIKLIIFDLGGVMISGGGYQEYMVKKMEISDKYYEATAKPITSMAMKGRLTEKQMIYSLSKKFGLPETTFRWPRRLRSRTKPNRELQRVVRKLRENYKVVLLSNMLPWRYSALVEKGMHKESIFYKNFVSFRIKMVKPDRSTFSFLLRKMRAKPKQTLFIDDLATNTEGARKLGINAITFKNNAQLFREMKKYNVVLGPQR